ncbi:endospore germination permease [Tepidibacillus marianensis]|uniref:GerAB/ArcD/ProY family transporter n=1 Tax=Tepidibacillus marianensis TaxID=3131995 RepID=UPI0030D2A677
MLEKGLINRFQLWLLVINFTIGSALLFIPSTIVIKSKQNGWISIILGTVVALVIISIYLAIAHRFPNQTLVEIFQTLFGRWLGKTIGLLYVWFFLHLTSLIVRNALDFVTTAIMPETPVIVFGIMAILLLLLVTYQGIEGIGRSNEFFTPIAVGGFWLTILLTIPDMKIENLSPIFTESFKPILRGMISTLGFPFSELVVFLMFLPFVNNRTHLKGIMRTGVIIGGFTLFIDVLSTILVLNIRPTEWSIYAPLLVARIINIADFLTRVEAVLSLSFVLMIFIKMSVSFYASVLAIAQVFELKDYRSIIVPMLFMVLTLSIILNENIVDILQYTEKVSTPYTLFFGFVIPLLVLGVTYIKQWRSKTKSEK